MFTSAFIGSKSHKKETKEAPKQDFSKPDQPIGPVFTDYEKKNESMISKEQTRRHQEEQNKKTRSFIP